MTHGISLHGKATIQQRIDHWQTMHDLRGGKGFRQAPTSRKNPDTHRSGPVTKLERLYELEDDA